MATVLSAVNSEPNHFAPSYGATRLKRGERICMLSLSPIPLVRRQESPNRLSLRPPLPPQGLPEEVADGSVNCTD